jgi:hypothetical protein
MDAPDRHRWWGEEPFPWVGLLIGTVFGALLLPVLAWLGFELIDQDLERWAQ